jgi:hypothetical protein
VIIAGTIFVIGFVITGIIIFLISLQQEDSFTIPESIEFNKNYELMKVNPDKIYATSPIIVNNEAVYYKDLKTNNYYSFDIYSKKTKKISEGAYNKENSKQTKLLERERKVVRDGNKLIYTYKDKNIEIDYLGGMRYAGNENYFVWSKYIVGGIDEIILLNVNDNSKRKIVPSENFISTEISFEGMDTFNVDWLGFFDNKILVRNMSCLYSYDIDTPRETKIFCDHNMIGSIISLNNLLFFKEIVDWLLLMEKQKEGYF